jgi:hypothetical protein
MPKMYIVGDYKRAKLGRLTDEVQTEAFLKVTEYLEHNDDEQITINTLIQKMAEYIDDIDIQPYGFTYMKAQIQKHFGNKVTITEINGRSNVVTFWSTATAILQEFHSQSKDRNAEVEKNRIILTAAQLIKNDIKSLIQKRDAYPSCHDMASIDEVCSFLPDSPQSCTDGKMKIASLGQAIVQATHPRVIWSPLQLGLGIQLHHHFSSKFLIDTLHKYGFCCSYKEVVTYERSAAVAQGTDLPNCTSDKCIQYVADNVDHAICTIDGRNTFHGMGIIATVTPATSSTRTIPRVTVSADDIVAVGRVNIQQFVSAFDGLQTWKYEKLQEHDVADPTANVDLLLGVSPSAYTQLVWYYANDPQRKPSRKSFHILLAHDRYECE